MKLQSGAKGYQIELIPNMYEIGLFRSILVSRARLRTVTACSVVGLIGMFAGVGYILRYVSTEFFINLALIVILYIFVVAVGYILALMFGDIFFAGPWREKMYRGAKYIPDKIEDQEALLRNKNLYFMLLFAASVAALGFGCDLCTGRNIRWYYSVGSGIVLLKSTDADDRARQIEMLSNALYSETWRVPEVKQQIIAMIDDENDIVKGWASYIAGEAEYVEAVPPLIQLMKNDKVQMNARSEAAIALGRLNWKPARAHYIAVLRKTFADNHHENILIPSILYAFYEMKDISASHETLQMLNTCLTAQDCSNELYQYAFFYLKSMKAVDTSDTAFKYINADIPLEQRCYAADSLRFASRKTDVPAMKHAFEITPMGAYCSVVYRKYHSEAAVILFEADPMRSLYVRAVGNYMQPDDYDWIWMIGSNTSEDDRTRKTAEMYTRAMKDRNIVK